VDRIAARLVTRGSGWGQDKAGLAAAERMAAHFEEMRARDAKEFSRRAASVLGRISAYAIYRYDRLVRENRLARLLFERSLTSLLEDADGLRDLVEASEIHVQARAYRVLKRAREAFALPDRKYPKEALLGLSAWTGRRRSESGAPVAEALRALARWCRRGRALYDVERREFRHRELFETPIDEAMLFPPDPRRERARRMVQEGQVRIEACATISRSTCSISARARTCRRYSRRARRGARTCPPRPLRSRSAPRARPRGRRGMKRRMM